MITPEIKDKVLNDFIAIGIHCEQDINSAYEEFGITPDELEIIIDQFAEQNLLVAEKCLGGLILIHLTANAFDLARLGGFVGRELIAKATIEKLELEIKSLKETYPEKAMTFTTILANLATLGGFFLANSR